MGCNCGKKTGAATQPKKIITRPPQTKPQVSGSSTLKRVIRRSAY